MAISIRATLLLLIVTGILPTLNSFAQESQRGHESQRQSNEAATNEQAASSEADPTEPRPKISDLAWIAGRWQGEAMGGSFEESWNPPFAGCMMGMFKFAKNGEVVFYELLTIVEENDSLLLRLKHFDKSLVGWEEKDKSIEFPFIRCSKTEIIFDGLKFLKIDETTMHILVNVKNDGEKAEELKFVCKLATE